MPAYEVFEEEIDDLLGPEYLSVGKVAQCSQMTEREVERAIKEGKLRAIRVGGTVRIHKREVRKFLGADE